MSSCSFENDIPAHIARALNPRSPPHLSRRISEDNLAGLIPQNGSDSFSDYDSDPDLDGAHVPMINEYHLGYPGTVSVGTSPDAVFAIHQVYEHHVLFIWTSVPSEGNQSTQVITGAKFKMNDGDEPIIEQAIQEANGAGRPVISVLFTSYPCDASRRSYTLALQDRLRQELRGLLSCQIRSYCHDVYPRGFEALQDSHWVRSYTESWLGPRKSNESPSLLLGSY